MLTESCAAAAKRFENIGVSMALLFAVCFPATGYTHGDVTPQAVDASSLPALGDDWLLENPWRSPDDENWQQAIAVGASGYNQNCARCHGLEAVSGGLAPDLRALEADEFGDEWYVERFVKGYTQNGTTKMPGFGEILSQEAAWAIRTYLEARPADGALDDVEDQLKTYRDRLVDMTANAANVDEVVDELANMRSAMTEIATGVKTASGAPQADSVVSRAVAALDGSDSSIKRAAEVLTIGLSAAQ